VLVIRATKILLKELTVDISEIEDISLLFSWHVNMFQLNNRKYLVFMNDLTRLSLSISGIRNTQYKNLKEIFLKELKEYLVYEQIDEAKISEYLNYCHTMVITKSNSRSVLSTLSEIMLVMKSLEKDKDFINNMERNKWNNRFIYKPINYAKPIDVFSQEIYKLN
jgi:hypothetical protein